MSSPHLSQQTLPSWSAHSHSAIFSHYLVPSITLHASCNFWFSATLKDSCNHSPVPIYQCASSTLNIEVSPQICPPVSALSLNSSDRTEGGTQLALWDAQQATKCMHPLSGPAIAVTSVGQDTQVDLDAADGFQDTYLKPLRIFDAVIGEIVNV
ncbi:uncharacterized protein F5147DRAFT_771606 [Suillus discolor]|uniref:Uncharacterized protein n=1 Tax=Suillus discolor TaxID=1912936 RepID=A0A9P7JWA1_9AGAM|nr:uncharacterized protein F5147DRAFT_771606 [Suillus discolor]KAG2112048.1 hypothetical protein F5147DRAFT_771606 [Suillus discolor]